MRDSLRTLIQIKGGGSPKAYRLASKGVAPLEDARELRKLAEWYRAFAELTGSAVERQRRLAHADYLERRAEELEKRSAADDPGKQPGKG
jgi:hypothetical protein